MAREKKKEEIILDDLDERIEIPKIPETRKEERKTDSRRSDVQEVTNCLRNEKIIVRFLARQKNGITDPNHVLFGGRSSRSKIKFPVPMLRSGIYADVLTKNEKAFLEEYMNLEYNALSIYNKKENNFWSDANPQGIGVVELTKGDNYFDLSNPRDYIKYKILLAWPNIIASSLQELQDRPKATYEFVIVNDEDASKAANTKVTLKAQAYKEFGKIENDFDKMRIIIETIDGKPVAASSKLEYLQGKIGDIIESNTKMFLSTAKDPLLDNKILLKKAIEAGVVANRSGLLFLREGNMPLCNNGEDSTLSVAAKYLSLPKNQELKFSIEAKINK